MALQRATRQRHAAHLARARCYPYAIPDGSYLYDGGRVMPMARPRDEKRGRVPVLAYGSNQSPAQLDRKFAHLAAAGGKDAVIPVERCRLVGFDVVYSAHFTGYGAVPAMLQVSPGTTVSLSVTWLTETQLDLMHESEIGAANYHYGRLERIELHLDHGSRLDGVHAYIGRRGSVLHDSAPVALKAMQADRRKHAARTTAEMLAIARDRLAPGLALEAFILRLVEDKAYRRRHGARFARDSVPFGWPHVRVPAG